MLELSTELGNQFLWWPAAAATAATAATDVAAEGGEGEEEERDDPSALAMLMALAALLEEEAFTVEKMDVLALSPLLLMGSNGGIDFIGEL